MVMLHTIFQRLSKQFADATPQLLSRREVFSTFVAFHIFLREWGGRLHRGPWERGLLRAMVRSPGERGEYRSLDNVEWYHSEQVSMRISYARPSKRHHQVVLDFDQVNGEAFYGKHDRMSNKYFWGKQSNFSVLQAWMISYVIVKWEVNS